MSVSYGRRNSTGIFGVRIHCDKKGEIFISCRLQYTYLKRCTIYKTA
ncbi:hypothetical protein HMPREF3033_00288 [Veillonellaceae bacterium DNF00751]|nr:hypothetical protein HMPREF3033_00288 [Veillonellaceae bacterium DNF00751]